MSPPSEVLITEAPTTEFVPNWHSWSTERVKEAWIDESGMIDELVDGWMEWMEDKWMNEGLMND